MPHTVEQALKTRKFDLEVGGSKNKKYCFAKVRGEEWGERMQTDDRKGQNDRQFRDFESGVNALARRFLQTGYSRRVGWSDCEMRQGKVGTDS